MIPQFQKLNDPKKKYQNNSRFLIRKNVHQKTVEEQISSTAMIKAMRTQLF